jgi:hypothetical protein
MVLLELLQSARVASFEVNPATIETRSIGDDYPRVCIT